MSGSVNYRKRTCSDLHNVLIITTERVVYDEAILIHDLWSAAVLTALRNPSLTILPVCSMIGNMVVEFARNAVGGRIEGN